MTGKCSRLRGNRPKAMWGSIVGGLINLGASYLSSRSQAKAMKQQLDAQKELAKEQMLATNQNSLANTLNNYATAQQSYDNQDYNLKYRNGGRKSILRNSNVVITDGGVAQPISNNTFLLRGGSHEDVNETGQTGIGINVGGNQIEAEGGEVAQEKNGALRIFSAQPILGNGMSPAQAILRGYNKDKVFAAQERFKRNNHLNDDGSKAKYGNEVPKKRLHVNEDGTLTDTLNGNNYHALATNGEDVVITGKANHWKEAGKKDTSSYFDPMGAVTFASAAGAPILNFTPSNIVGSIREAKDYNSFMHSFMNNDNGGFFTKEYAEKHPYISFFGNMIGDAAGGGLGNKGIDLVHGRMNYAPYRKLTYKANRLAKKTGLWRPNNSQINYHDYVYKSIDDYTTKLYERFPDKYSKRVGTDEDLQKLKQYYKDNVDVDENYARAMAKANLTGFDIKEGDIDRLTRIYRDNPEYLEFVNQVSYNANPLAQYTVDDFLKRQGRSVRGVHADDLQDATEYLTTTQKGRHLSGGDRLDTNGGLYTSNSNDIADRFKNPEVGESNGYVGTLQYNFNVDKNKPIEDQLYQARSQVYFDPTKSDKGYYHPFTYNNDAREIVRDNPNIKAIEANYGRSTGQFLPSNERAYLPSKNVERRTIETPVTLENVDEYIDSKNTRGRWGAGNTNNDLFISQSPNNTTDFIRDARILLSKTKDPRKLFQVGLSEQNKRIKRFDKASKLRGNTRYGTYDFTKNEINDNYIIPIKDYLYDKASANYYKLKTDIKYSKLIKSLKQKADDIHQLISPSYRRFRQTGYNSLEDYDNIEDYNLMNDVMKYENYIDNDRNSYNYQDLPFRLGGKVCKLRLGGRARYAKGGWVKPVYPTVGYHGSKRVRQYIAKAEGSDFAKQNKQFKGDAIGAKELELRNFMGKAYQHLNEGQRDALLSYYYNLTPKTFVNQYKGLRDKLINAQTEQEYNDTINAMKNSINVGWNNAKLPGLRNRRAVERSWFGYVNPTVQQMVNDKINQIETAPVDNTMVQRPIIVETPQQEVHVPAGVVPVQNTEPNLFNGNIKQNIIDMGNQFRKKHGLGGDIKRFWNFIKSPRTLIHDIAALATAYQKLNPNSEYNKQKGKFGGGNNFDGSGASITWTDDYKPKKGFANFNDAYDDAVNHNVETFVFGNKRYNTWKENNPIRELNNRAVGTWRDSVVTKDRNGYGKDFGPIRHPATAFPIVTETYDSRRKKHSLGGASRHIKGMYTCGGSARPKAFDGTQVFPYATKEKNYWEEQQAEVDARNQAIDNIQLKKKLDNQFNGQIPYRPTDYNPEDSKLSTSKLNDGNLDFNDNNSRLLFGTGDYVSLGADLFSALGSSIINSSAYNGLNFDYDLPGYVDESPVALNTTYHNEAQVANVERNRLNARNSILRNSMSSGSALSRVQSADTNAMYQQNQLFDEKSNKETELRNQNLLNEQQVRARNAAAKNQWLQSVAGIKNSAIAAKNQAQLAKANSLSVGLSGVGQAVNNFISQGRQNYDDEQAMLMGIAASDYATPSRLIDLGVNLSPSTLAGIYRSIANTPNPGDAPRPEDYSSTTEYSIAKNAYDRNIKAYNNRNAYANLIKGRMSLKNRNRYGII